MLKMSICLKVQLPYQRQKFNKIKTETYFKPPPFNPRGTRGGLYNPLCGTFFYNSRTTKAFNFKFWHSAQNLSGCVCAKFQGHMTPTYDVIAIFWQAPPQKMAILVYFLNFNSSFDTNDITMKLCKRLKYTSN